MIDWITAIIPCNHPELIFGGRVTSITPDGEIEWHVEKKKQVAGSHESNLNIKSIGLTHHYFDGNTAKWLQGHNLFGSNDLIGLVQAVLEKLPDIEVFALIQVRTKSLRVHNLISLAPNHLPNFMPGASIR